MKITTWSDTVEEFVSQNADLAQKSEEGVIIHIFETMIGPLRIAIDVDGDITKTKLEKSISLALDWRKRLTQYQGNTWIYSDYRLLRLIDENMLIKDETLAKKSSSKYARSTMFYDRFSYADIAIAVNELISRWMYESINITHASIEDPPGFKILNLFLAEIENRIPDAKERSYKLLKVFRMGDNNIKQLLDAGVSNIHAGLLPFEKDYPLSRDKVIRTMRWSREKNNT